jgi:hypothetical protein
VRQPDAAGENIERFPRLAANELASLWTWIYLAQVSILGCLELGGSTR